MRFDAAPTAIASAILAENKGKVIKICENCKYLREEKCYRFPPTPLVDEDDFYSYRPTVALDDFCGEFKEKK